MGVGAGLYMCDVVVKKFTFSISSPDELLLKRLSRFLLSLRFYYFHLVAYAVFMYVELFIFFFLYLTVNKVDYYLNVLHLG